MELYRKNHCFGMPTVSFFSPPLSMPTPTTHLPTTRLKTLAIVHSAHSLLKIYLLNDRPFNSVSHRPCLNRDVVQRGLANIKQAQAIISIACASKRHLQMDCRQDLADHFRSSPGNFLWDQNIHFGQVRRIYTSWRSTMLPSAVHFCIPYSEWTS